MKIKILKSTSQELIDGFWFYEKQSKGLGTYFLDTLFSDIDLLTINAGIHQNILVNIIVRFQKDFPLQFIIKPRMIWF